MLLDRRRWFVVIRRALELERDRLDAEPIDDRVDLAPAFAGARVAFRRRLGDRVELDDLLVLEDRGRLLLLFLVECLQHLVVVRNLRH